VLSICIVKPAKHDLKTGCFWYDKRGASSYFSIFISKNLATSIYIHNIALVFIKKNIRIIIYHLKYKYENK